MRQCSAVPGALFYEIQKLLELAFGCYTRCNWKTFVGTAVEVSLESVRNPPKTRTIGLTQKNPKPKSKRTYYIYKYANKRQCLTRLMRKERRSSWVWVACSYNWESGWQKTRCWCPAWLEMRPVLTYSCPQYQENIIDIKHVCLYTNVYRLYIADSAQKQNIALLSTVCTGVTSQFFSIIWWFRAWKPYIFWKHMSHSQMLGKVESGGGPIFKVVLEC